MSWNTLIVEKKDGIATVTLNRPDRLNALNSELMTELGRALDEIEADAAIRCLLLTGAGRGFCSGADLASGDLNNDGGMPDLGRALHDKYHPVIRKLAAYRMPVVCAVNGPAAGAGMSLALCGDIVIAAKSATFLQAFANIGLVPDAGSTFFLPRLAGTARALGLTMLGEKLPAETAAEWGLIWKCVEDDALMEEAGKIAAKFASGPTVGLAQIRKLIRQSATNGLDAQLEAEREAQAIAGRTRDFIEGVSAFLQKRPAKFSGK
ncbi:MAG TPA: enoyl-CoA hydratase-related protein [Ferrovibrio sp.]|uniref:enoyl-CoA hydratase-related protein n=1 Tax=Ferrovibrio sp. TaxID=1917215 RepID=UPI002B4B42EC|nr:enoyl-CoA hydratase-related protein [Ferrovibrio sp.]HLT78366.1 enoyl-CoA hydratase-related protein [Ferrovibrio sp.]